MQGREGKIKEAALRRGGRGEGREGTMASAVNRPVHAGVCFLVLLAYPKKHRGICMLRGGSVGSNPRIQRGPFHDGGGYEIQHQFVYVLNKRLVMTIVVADVSECNVDMFFTFLLQCVFLLGTKT